MTETMSACVLWHSAILARGQALSRALCDMAAWEAWERESHASARRAVIKLAQASRQRKGADAERSVSCDGASEVEAMDGISSLQPCVKELKKAGGTAKVDRAIEKKRKRNANRAHKFVPYERRGDG